MRLTTKKTGREIAGLRRRLAEATDRYTAAEAAAESAQRAVAEATRRAVTAERRAARLAQQLQEAQAAAEQDGPSLEDLVASWGRGERALAVRLHELTMANQAMDKELYGLRAAERAKRGAPEGWEACERERPATCMDQPLRIEDGRHYHPTKDGKSHG